MPHKRLGGDLLGSFCGALGLGGGNTEQVWEPRLAPCTFWEVMSGEFPLEPAGFVLPVLAPVRSGTNYFPRERRVGFHFAREKRAGGHEEMVFSVFKSTRFTLLFP